MLYVYKKIKTKITEINFNGEEYEATEENISSIKDNMNMGCTMAPAAAELIYQHFQDTHKGPVSDFDQRNYCILLGSVHKAHPVNLRFAQSL